MPIKQEKAFKILGDKIKIVHMHNNYRFNDDHVAPTLGTIDWESLILHTDTMHFVCLKDILSKN